MTTKNYIIFTCSYDDNNGGVVVLHQLCDLLNKCGEKAFIWNCHKPIFSTKHIFKTILKYMKYFRKNLKYGFKTNPLLDTPVATKHDLMNSIVIYAEVVDGNPLNAKHVIRWLLHKPGFNSAGRINYGNDELFFFYLKAYDDARFNKDGDNLLHIENTRSNIYKPLNNSIRKGTCYILRKGKNREIVHDTKNSILIDGKSHEEIAEIFNSVEYCISYDTYTMYSVYAVMCGCISIIVPEKGVSKKEWQPNEEDCYGLAYGFDDIEYALNTRELLLNKLQNMEYDSLENVKVFINKSKDYFINE